MATGKIVSTDYNIQTTSAFSNVNITTHTVKINGNLQVFGNVDSISSNDLTVSDNTIILNNGELGAGITLGTSGLQIDRGSESDVGLRFNEDPAGDGSHPPAWELTEDGINWNYVLQSNVGGSGLTAVVDDSAPVLGGNLNITGHTIYSTVPNVAIYTNTVATGETGVYVDTAQKTQQELVTKNRSLVYSLIL